MQTPLGVNTSATHPSWSAVGANLIRPKRYDERPDAQAREKGAREVFADHGEARKDHEASSFWLRPCPRACRRSYPLLGALLALGSPVGYLLLRILITGRAFSSSVIREEIASDPLTFAYLLSSALLAFVLLGWLLGRKEDALLAASATDPLTGLWNRRHLDARLTEEVGRAAHYGGSLAFLIIDLDKLKVINDRGGHKAGDLALRRVARCLRQTCRSTDIPARYGGDEFVVLAPDSDAAQALELAERIRAAVRRDDPSDPISVSIGVSDLERAGAFTEDALRDSADRALYEAKATGRDRVSLAPPRPRENKALVRELARGDAR
jgi:diguanylate cyclase (GGDEF)-like protein